MGLAPSPWNIDRKILDEIAKKLQIKNKYRMRAPNCG